MHHHTHRIAHTTAFVVEHCLEERKEMFYLMMHSTHFIYGYMASDIWLRTIQIARQNTRLAARVHLYASSHRQDNTYHDLCYTQYILFTVIWCQHCLEWQTVQRFHQMESIQHPTAPWADALDTIWLQMKNINNCFYQSRTNQSNKFFIKKCVECVIK